MSKLIQSIRKTNKEFHLGLNEFQIELLAVNLYKETIMENNKEKPQLRLVKIL